jgi:hypothetical protein
MSDVTRILSAIEQGDAGAASQLLPLVYDELRRLAAQKMAHEQPGQTLEATALKLASQYPRPCAVTRIQLGQVSGGVIRAILFLSDRTWLGND